MPEAISARCDVSKLAAEWTRREFPLFLPSFLLGYGTWQAAAILRLLAYPPLMLLIQTRHFVIKLTISFM